MTKKDTERKQRYCLACGRPLTGRQRKWCSNDDCEGKLQRVKFAQERLNELRSKAKEYADDEDMKARYDRWILDAETDLEILKGTTEPFHVTCSSCGKSIKTNYNPDLEPDIYNGLSRTVGWFCIDCKRTLYPPEENRYIGHDLFGNVRLMDLSRWFEHIKD
jgi:hypothetical protein